MTPTEVCNLALAEIGIQTRIRSIDPPDASSAGAAAATFYKPKIRALLRSVNWDFARAQVFLTLWKDASQQPVPGVPIGQFQIGVSPIGSVPGNAPPQPFMFSYLVPVDCLDARFVLPTIPPGMVGFPIGPPWIPPRLPTDNNFVIGTDFDEEGNPVKVIMTNVPQAQLVYTRDLSDIPDAWDALFLSCAASYLATFFIQALARNRAQLQDQIGIAKNFIDEARAANGNESITSIDNVPDWLKARGLSGPWPWSQRGISWQSLQFPDGLSY